VRGEVVQVGHEVAVGEHPEMDVPVVRDDCDVEPERVIDGDKRPDVEELRTACVKRKLRAWNIGGDEVHDRLPGQLSPRRNHAAGESLERRRRPVGEVAQRVCRHRLPRTL
jgi:hypothetical protein